jgi:serine/threonine-protein kinase 40
MWALGVVFYTMLYGQFPFFDQTPAELFRKIKAVEFVIPM